MDEKNLEALNRFNKAVAVTPPADLDRRQKAVEFYYTDGGKLILFGMLGNTYVFWVSVTDIADKELNSAIFAHIIEARPEAVTDLFRSTSLCGFSMGQLIGFYHEWLTCDNCEGTGPSPILWKTPFGGGYGRMTPANTGNCFARDILEHYQKLKQQCIYRAAGGAYHKILQSYLQFLSQSTGDPCRDYLDRKPLLDLLDKESYLLCAEDPTLRELYLKLIFRRVKLYNDYMAIAR